MQAISNISPELLEILTEFSDFFYSRDFSHLERAIGKNPRLKEVAIRYMHDEATSLEYLNHAIDNPNNYGFPRHSWGLEFNMDAVYFDDEELKKKAKETNNKLMNFFGARNNALQMFYPAGGYIGWHHNANASGYNIVLSCNPGGDGEFEHWDHINGTLNVFKDDPGWNCKVGYFGSFKEPEKMYWHCARTRTPRLTFSYVVYDKNLWESMVDDINADS
jgi:hypothetical protein